MSEAGSTDLDDVAGREVLLLAIRSLPQKQRSVVVLRYYLDWSERDIAAALHCSPGTVKSQSSKALARLRRDLADETDLQESNG